MNYMNLLSREEKAILCGIITGREFKEFFKKNGNEFQKIQRGFQAKTLQEPFALKIATDNIDKPFITMWVNTRIDNWLKEIQENIEKFEGEGSNRDAALATTLLDSVFSNHVSLYLKLAEKILDMNAHAKLSESMKIINIERMGNEANHIKGMEEEKNHLLAQLETMRQRVDAVKEECEQKIQKAEQDKNAVESLLAEAQEKIIGLQTAPVAANSKDADYLAQFDDTDFSVLPSVDSDEIVSLCSVITIYNGEKRLVRHADLNYEGQYCIFHRSEDASAHFTNWDKIFHKDGPSDDGFYGIWNWSGVPNNKDSSRYYILSQYNMNLDAIEIVAISDASSLDGLIERLKNGIECQPHSRRIMFAIYTSNGQYIGILCSIKDLNTINGKTAFVEDCIEVPVYGFAYGDILRLDNGLSFYKNAFAGIPRKLYQLKSPLDVVKRIVFSSISWTSYKTRGVTLTRAEHRAFKDFLGAIPVDDITCKIEAACRCSNFAAKELLKEFLNVVWKYVDGDSLEDGIILSAISASTELEKKTKMLIRTDWEAENRSLLAEARKELDSLEAQLGIATTKLSEVQEAIKKTELEEKQLADSIAEKKKMAKDVEIAVAEKIQKARENAADFMANMAFVSGQPMQAAGTATYATGDILPKPVLTSYHRISAYEDLTKLEPNHTWADVMNTVDWEFEEAGVMRQYSRGLSAFLCAAYIEKQPILLVGPNAIDIVQAFSAAIMGHKQGVLCCEGSYSNETIKEIGADGENIVIINNLFTSGWMNRLPEIFSQKDIFFVITHPYAEDIQVEPKSLYGYVLPLFTEFFVDKKASGRYNGGYFADDFETYSASKGVHKELRVLSKFALSSLVRNRINSLVATMRDIYSDMTLDDEFLFAIFPIAYATLEIKELIEIIADPQKGVAISANLKRDLQYVLGDV